MYYVLILKPLGYLIMDDQIVILKDSGLGVQSYLGCVAVATLLLSTRWSEMLPLSGNMWNCSLELRRLYGFSPII